MFIESTPYSLQAKIKSLKTKYSVIGLVPTMGGLHEGHMSLIKASQEKTDKTVVSIFVNPSQFGKNEDYHTYPRTLENDILLLQNQGVDIVFTPSVADMYPISLEETIQVREPVLSGRYCGVTRPQLFDGVCQVVLRLFNIVMPDKAFFGEKDYQQLTVIKKMVKDLFLPIEIIGCPIVREPNGLAVSTRNQYLTESEKQESAVIYQAMLLARKLVDMEETMPDKILEKVTHMIETESSIRIDYIQIVDSVTLLPKESAKKHDRLLFAGYLGNTRLIDNLSL